MKNDKHHVAELILFGIQNDVVNKSDFMKNNTKTGPKINLLCMLTPKPQSKKYCRAGVSVEVSRKEKAH